MKRNSLDSLAFHANSGLRLTPRKFEFSLVNKEFDNLIAEHENKTCVVPSNRAAVIHKKTSRDFSTT